jgi:hypothetical protein
MLKTYLLALIIGLQAAFGLNATVDYLDELNAGTPSRPAAENSLPADSAQSVARETDFLAAIKEMGITIHPDTAYSTESRYSAVAEKHCAELVFRTLSVMPEETVDRLKNLTFYYTPSGRRGLGGNSTVILRCQEIGDRELVSVLVHELAHLYDTGVLEGSFLAGKSSFMDGSAPIYKNDPSLEFYRLSFLDESTLKPEAAEEDFVTGYAMTDPFEDFAETYNFYLLQGRTFRALAEQNKILKSKYLFMRDRVFAGQEFDYSSSSDRLAEPLVSYRNYDSTLLGFDLKKFLANS